MGSTGFFLIAFGSRTDTSLALSSGCSTGHGISVAYMWKVTDFLMRFFCYRSFFFFAMNVLALSSEGTFDIRPASPPSCDDIPCCESSSSNYFFSAYSPLYLRFPGNIELKTSALLTGAEPFLESGLSPCNLSDTFSSSGGCGLLMITFAVING